MFTRLSTPHPPPTPQPTITLPCTTSSPRLHKDHHMHQEYDVTLGSWRGYVDFETTFFVVNQTMLGLTPPSNSDAPPPCLFWSDLAEFVDPKSVPENADRWCQDQFTSMKRCRSWAVHHTHNHNRAASQTPTKLFHDGTYASGELQLQSDRDSGQPAPEALAVEWIEESYVAIDETTDPRDYPDVKHVIQQAGQDSMQRRASFVAGLANPRVGQPLT